MPSPPDVGVAEAEVLDVPVELDVDEVGVAVDVNASEIVVLMVEEVCALDVDCGTIEEVLLD